jgi:hypothetical protein
MWMMFLPDRRNTPMPPRSVTDIVLLSYMWMMFAPHGMLLGWLFLFTTSVTGVI